MSGHSKWATIKRKKGALDAKRGTIFTKIIKEIVVASRMGGGDPETNAALRTATLKAKAANMPKDNVERAIKKGIGELDGANYVELVYEGYANGGVAVIVETLTDNKNRTAADVRSIFAKNGGNLGESNSVSYMFNRKGILSYDGEKYSEDTVLETALEAGAEDVNSAEGIIEVSTAPLDFEKVLSAMEKAGFVHEGAEVSMIADVTISLEKEATLKVLKLVDLLEEHDDVQNVYHNLAIPDDMDLDS